MAVTVVSCTTPIFLLLDKVCSLLSSSNSWRCHDGGKILSRTFPDDAVWNHQGMHEPHLLSITVKETGHKENLPATEWPIRSSTAEAGRVNFYLLQYTIIEPVWQDFFWKNLIFFFRATPMNFWGLQRKKEKKRRKWQLSRIGMDWNDKSECIMIFPTKNS